MGMPYYPKTIRVGTLVVGSWNRHTNALTVALVHEQADSRFGGLPNQVQRWLTVEKGELPAVV